jgi:Galactose oxidase, central domain
MTQAHTALILTLLLWGSAGEPEARGQTAGTFTATGSMITPRSLYTATLLPGGKVLFAGGQGADNRILSSAELYDPSTGLFTPTGYMTVARFGHSATLLPDGRVLIASGSSGFSAELYDPSSGTFTATGDMVNAGVNGTAILLANGKVLIAHDSSPYAATATAELYDPVPGTFSATGNQLLIWGGDQKAALLADGRVLLMICCTAEQLYDPASGTFSLTGRTTRVYPGEFAAAPLTNSKVLRTGGYEDSLGTVTAGAELYDPSSATFVPTGNMTLPRYYHTATPLGDGAVMIAGGGSSGYLPDIASASAELYDPATGAFSRTGEMNTGRRDHTATLLSDGTVLIAGGQGADAGILVSAELYHPLVPVPAPVLVSLSADGKGQGAIWHAATGQVASANNPATAGETLSMYTTSLVGGGVIPPQVAASNRLAEILYFGGAPGYLSYNQVNFRLPNGVPLGLAVPVRLTYLGRPSNEVTIGVQ